MNRRFIAICVVLSSLALALFLLPTPKPTEAQSLGAAVTATNTHIPCGAIIVVTSTLTPTMTSTPTRTATATPTACGPIYITATPGAPAITGTPTPAVFASGHVRVGSSTGALLPGVKVCYYLAAYTFECDTNTTLTDQNGYYQLSICTPQQEDVTIMASMAGYTFSPYYTIWYGGCMNRTIDFIAQSLNSGTPSPTPTATLTRTPVTPLPSFTPTATLRAGACSPVTASIAAPFTQDGAGTFCWQATNLGSYVNSWNLASLTINGVNFTNRYVAAGSLPAKINGYWYVSYQSSVAWGHFETK